MALVTPRSVGLMLAAAAVAGWFEAGTLLDTAPGATVAQQSRRPSARTATPRASETHVPDVTRLRDWRNAPPSPSRGRNPFVFGARPSARESSFAANEPIVATPPPVVVEPPMPMFTLSGIASNTEAGTVTLTAIIIDNGTMVFAKKGDRLSNGYSVVDVGEGSVTLVDAAGVTQTVRLQ